VTKTGKAFLATLCGLLGMLISSQPCLAEDLHPADIWTDTKLYFTAPLRWDTTDWLYFGGAVAAVAAAHQYDGNVRRHFVTGGSSGLNGGKDPNSLRDAAPTAALVAGTWAVGTLLGDSAGRVEAYTMLEAGAFSSVTAYMLKYAAARSRPNQTTRVDQWRSGGSSFPSLHTTAAFAMCTVFAESGGEEYRWIRRFLGYGIAGATAYIRVKDNQHWLSDTVAGAAIGAATARFTLNRRDFRAHQLDISVAPGQGGGVMFGVNWTLQ
jgi:membrane-associated phospholipid phosphatase